MKYYQVLKLYENYVWNKPVYVWESRTKDEFSGKTIKIIGIELRHSIRTIPGGLYNKDDFRRRELATPELVSKINGIKL